MGQDRTTVSVDYENYPCAFCGQEITTQWARGANGEQLGMLSIPGHCLIGNAVAHDDCLNQSLEDYERNQNP